MSVTMTKYRVEVVVEDSMDFRPGDLAEDVVRAIVDEIVDRANKSWQDEGERADCRVRYSGAEATIFVTVTTKVEFGNVPSTEELEEMRRKAEAYAYALLREIGETLQLAKRMTFISTALTKKVLNSLGKVVRGAKAEAD